ncbi:MAG: sulfatase-like hydrolase/transferase, partial [Cyclobacteriaceae bacterium]|nr:sulfatase-like hydrolase/transferase [Cyclobacteriaceae bacterium]
PQFSSGIVADKTMAWLDKRNRNKPFFIYIPFHEPHVVCDAPDEIKEKYLNRISNGEIPLIEGTGADGLGMAEYFASVENMDIAIGRIMKKLASEELLDNTFILFTSDNGPDSNRKYKGRLQSVGETGEFRGRKRWLLEGGIRQASIVYWNNKVKAGSSINTPIGHVDLLPTLCEIAGVNVPNDRTVDGISLVSNLKGEANERKGNPLHWHFYSPHGDSPQSVLRSGKWIITANWDMPRPKGRFNLSAIENIKRANLIDFKLYNIEDDHEQLNDMKELHPDIHKNLMKQLIEIHKSVKEECPGKDIFVWNNHLQYIVDKNFLHLKE